MVPSLSRLDRRDDGAIAILTVLLTSFVFIGLCALVVDTGLARDNRRQAQNAADASALAAGNVLYSGTGGAVNITAAINAAKAYAATNYGVTDADWKGCPDDQALAITPDTVVPLNSCISFDNLAAPTTVRVRVPLRQVNTPFAQIWKKTPGSATVPVDASAKALLGTAVTCSLCFLGPIDAGNGDFTVNGGSVAVNGSLSAGPGSKWTATTIGVVGAVSGGVLSPSATTIPSFSDPLLNTLTLPLVLTGPPVLTTKTDPCKDGPGLYGAVGLPKGACNLASGLYVISGLWDMKNNTDLTGTGVTLYVKTSGALDFTNGTVAITAPTVAPFPGVSPGYAIIYDRDNTNNLGLQGNGGTEITGIVYAPASKLDFNGNSCFGFSKGPIVVSGVIKANGTKSCVKVSSAVDATVARTGLHLSQ